MNQNLEELTRYKLDLENELSRLDRKKDLKYMRLVRLKSKLNHTELLSSSLEIEEIEKDLAKIVNEQLPILYSREEELIEKISDVDKKILLLKPLDGFNDVVDLRSVYSKAYNIYLHDQNQVIGYIEYRNYHCSDYLGDIGYCIYADYQGHGYAYEALCVLGEILAKKGIQDFWISTSFQNISSLRTIEKYGGVLKKNFPDGVVLYECQTLRKDEQIQKK